MTPAIELRDRSHQWVLFRGSPPPKRESFINLSLPNTISLPSSLPLSSEILQRSNDNSPKFCTSSRPAPPTSEGAAGTTDKASTLGLTLNQAHLPEVWFQVREALPGRGLEVHETRLDGGERGDAVQAALEADETRAARMWDGP